MHALAASGMAPALTRKAQMIRIDIQQAGYSAMRSHAPAAQIVAHLIFIEPEIFSELAQRSTLHPDLRLHPLGVQDH